MTQRILWGLVSRSVVAFAGADLHVFLERGDFDAAIPAIGIELRRLVRDHVLAAQLVFDRGEGMRDVLHLVRKECTPSGGIGKLLEDAIAAQH